MNLQEKQLSVELRQAVGKTVPAGEKIVWTGQPRMCLFKPSDWIQIPFMVIWTGIAATIGVLAVSSGAPIIPFGILPLIFVSIGLYTLVGRHLIAYQYLKNCVFVLTENRAYTVSAFPSPQTRSIEITSDTPVTVAQRDGRACGIYFADLPVWALASLDPTSWTVINDKNAPPAFFYIDDADAAINFLTVRARVNKQELLGVAALMIPNRSGGSIMPTSASVMPSAFNTIPAVQGSSEFVLRPDETMIWQGKPEFGLRFRKGELIASPLILIMSALISWPVYALLHIAPGQPTGVSYWIVFAAMTVLLLALSAISELMIKLNTKYAVTNQRVLALWSQAPQMVRTYAIDLNRIESVHSSVRDDDSGTIAFNRKNSFLVNTFGAEGITLDPMLTSRSEPFLLDVPKARSVARLIEQHRIAARQALSRSDAAGGDSSQRAALVARRTPRKLPEGIANRLTFGSNSFVLMAFTAGVASVVAAGHMAGYDWPQLLELIKLLQHGKVVADNGFPPIGFLIPVGLAVVAICIIVNHFRSTNKQLALLQLGTATKGTYSTERVVGTKNNQAWFVEREFEFFDRDGVRRQSKMLVKAQAPIKREVTVLFDLNNPDNSVVIDELAGGLALGANDELKRKS